MTLKLILVRHAKSDRGQSDLADHDRPLTSRGERAASMIGDWLARRGHVPGLVVASTAQRTLATWAGIETTLDADVPVQPDNRIYHGDAATLLEVVRGAPASPLLMVGHNPAIGAFAARILSAPPDHPRFAGYPTCACLVAEFDIEAWHNAAFGIATPCDFVVPRELE